MKRRFLGRRLLAVAGLGLLGLAGGHTQAQVAQPQVPQVPRVQVPGAVPPAMRVRAAQFRVGAARRIGAGEAASLDGVFLPPDRQARRRLEMAEEMIGEGRYGEGVRLLGSVLENSEDFFFKPNPDEPVYRSLKAEAGRILARLPREGRESYELQFGAKARTMLREAAAKGDFGEIAEVARRFFFTQAGAEATYLLGRHYLDQNRPLAAALSFEHLRQLPEAAAPLEPLLSLSLATCQMRSGQPDKARAVLAQLKRERPGAEVIVAGRPVKLFATESTALAWMEQTFGKQPLVEQTQADQWALHRGDESRNAASAGGQPLLSVRWRQRTSDDRTIEQFVAKLRHDYLSQNIVALSSMHPLAVGDVVIMRTAFALQAVDFETGKLVWKYPAGDDSLEVFLRALGSQQAGQGTQQLLAGLDSRMWEDATYGTLSSDGQRVYYIEDLAIGGSANFVTTVLPNGQRRYASQARGTNRLAARELRTQGKLKWEVGGLSGEDEPKLAGAFFLGPPLPLLGNLYALAEIKGQEIRLVALSPDTGALQWSQQLAVVDPPITQDMPRRYAGTSPSFADGVLVCPTSAGAVVGLDLSTRSLLWGYQYPRQQQYLFERANGRGVVYPGAERRPSEHWTDATVAIANGRVLVTPVESDQLYCLNLLDGKELWKHNRGTNLYVACVHEGKVIVVGQNIVSALNLSDGQKAWTDLMLPDSAIPSGRGFHSGEFYYLPLASAEVVKINLNTGKIEARARSRTGTIPGNLVAYRDGILSQSADYLDVYFQLDALKKRVSDQLANTPDDPRALAALGEVKLDEGQLNEAIDLFRRSYKIDADEGTREQLIESLLFGLRSNFAAFRASLPELEGLVDQSRHRLEFLRLKAIGLQQAGDVLPAFEAYMQLVDEDAPWTLDDVDDRLSVRRDRWIRQQLTMLRAAADNEVRGKIDAAVATRLQQALSTPSAESLRAFLNVFGAEGAAGAARMALVDRLPVDEILEQNLLLDGPATSSDPQVAGPAVARLAVALRQAGRVNEAAIYYRQLAGRLADVPCQGDKTGQQIVAELPADDPIAKLIAVTEAWPQGNVAIKDEKTLVRGARAPHTVDLEIHGPRSALFAENSLSLTTEAQQQNLTNDDGFGRKLFRIPLAEQGQRRPLSIQRTAYNAPSINYARVYGGLIVLSTGTQLTAVDTLRGEGASRVLWAQDLTDQVGGVPTVQTIVPRPINLPWGQIRYLPEDTYGRRYGAMGPLTDDGVYFQRLHDIYCVEPLSGKTIWTRKNVGLGHDLFGDGEYLFAAPPHDGDTLVLRAATGEQVGTRRIATLEKRMATLGRLLLTWESSGGQHAIVMRDVFADKQLWTHTFAPGSKAAIVSQEVVGVLQPNGEFTLVQLSDGKLLAKEALTAENALLGIHLLPWDGGYLLVTHTAARGEPNVTINPFPNIGVACPLVTGRVYGFDRAGKKLWTQPVPVSQHGLLLSQPRSLPVLVLARQIQRPGIGARDPKLSILCIDKRTGRLVYHKEDLPGTTIGTYDLLGDPAGHSVTMALAQRTITLDFTNDPIETPAAPAPDPVKVEPPKPEPAKQE